MIKGGPKIIEDGLVLNLDASDKKSFSGIDVVNRSPGVNFNYGNSNSSTFKVKQNESVIDIPQIGKRTVKYYYTYNDYNGGSGQCCPNFINYGQATGLSGSTLYTYTIIYKTESGYTNGNFMYRYEYNASATYLTEQGVFNNSNRVHLGDGWYKAWGTFTTQSTTSYANLSLFYYQYATYDIIYVADVSLHEGTYIPHHRHFPTSSSNGGWKDTSGNSNNGTLVNGVSWSNDNQGSLEFDGSNDYITISSPSFTTLSTHSVCAWVNTDDVTGWRTIIDFDNDEWLLATNGKNFTTYDPTFYSGYYLTAGTWHHVCRAHETGGPIYLYLDGALVYTSTNVSVSKTFSKINIGAGLIGSTPNELWDGKIAQVQMYSRKLSTAEVLSNYNATKNRFS